MNLEKDNNNELKQNNKANAFSIKKHWLCLHLDSERFKISSYELSFSSETHPVFRHD